MSPANGEITPTYVEVMKKSYPLRLRKSIPESSSLRYAVTPGTGPRYWGALLGRAKILTRPYPKRYLP